MLNEQRSCARRVPLESKGHELLVIRRHAPAEVGHTRIQQARPAITLRMVVEKVGQAYQPGRRACRYKSPMKAPVPALPLVGSVGAAIGRGRFRERMKAGDDLFFPRIRSTFDRFDQRLRFYGLPDTGDVPHFGCRDGGNPEAALP